MTDRASLVQAIQRDPAFQELVGKRRRFAWSLTAAMLAIYFGYIAVVAFAPQWLGVLIGPATTIGIPIGLAVIAAALFLTGLYVYRANAEFDRLTGRIREGIK